MAVKPIPWRVSWDLPDKTQAGVSAGTFDELVVGELVHVEHLGQKSYFVRVGALTVWVSQGKSGETIVSHVELRGEDVPGLRKQLDAMLNSGQAQPLVTPKWKPKETEFWDNIQKSADTVKSAPVWSQGGIVLSKNFEGQHEDED